MRPTKIYVKSILNVRKEIPIKAISHITGGGLLENIPRVLPGNVLANIDCNSWQWPSIFHWLKGSGDVSNLEMNKTFNCGVGLVLVISNDYVNSAIALLQENGEDAWLIGDISERMAEEPQINLLNLASD